MASRLARTTTWPSRTTTKNCRRGSRSGDARWTLQAHLLSVQEQLAALAARDPLTGILNRRAILDRLAEELSRATRQGGRLTVGMCDVDHFKAVNDTYGHQAGDEVLRGFTAAVQEQLRKYDSVGRYGGEEFLVIAPGVTNGGGVGIFDRLCTRVSGVAMPTDRARSRLPSASAWHRAAAGPRWTRCWRLPTRRCIGPRPKAGTAWSTHQPRRQRRATAGRFVSWPVPHGHVVGTGAGG